MGLRDRVRRDRAKKCVNMHDFGYCGSLPEGKENRMCYILKPRMEYNTVSEEEEWCDYCPFKGIYGFHAAEGGAK